MAKDEFDDLSMDMFEEFDIDAEPDKKKGKVAKVAEAVASLIKDTAKGAAKGIGKEVNEQFRDISEVYQEAIDTVDDFSRLKSDISQEIGPATNTMKQITLRMLPKAKSFIPEKYYKSIEDKLKSSITPPDISASQREAQMKQETIRDALASIFQQQMQASQAQATQDAANMQVDRQVAHIRFKATSEALSSIDKHLFTMTDFLTGTFTGYIKKSLELKYNHLFIARDTFNAVRNFAKIVEARLIDIQKNTGLPDFAKRSQYHKNGVGALKRGSNQTSTEFYSTFRQKFMKNAKDQIMGPLQMFTQQLLPMMDMGSQMASMGGPTKITDVLGMIGGLGGSIYAGSKTKKFMNDNQGIVDLINNFTKGLKNRGQSKLEDWADKHRGFGGGPLSFIANLIPKFNRDTTVKNTLMEDQFETVPFDALTRQTIVEIIPAHLENIAKYVTGMAMTLAPGAKFENITFDKTTRKIETAATASEHYINYYSGGKEARNARSKEGIDRIKTNELGRKGIDPNSKVGKDLVKKYDAVEEDLKKFIHNSSWYHQSFKVHELIDWYNTGNETEYIQKVFEGCEHPKDLCDVLLGSIVDKSHDNEGNEFFNPDTIDGISLTNIENMIIDHFGDADYIRKVADSINTTGDARVHGDLAKGNRVTNLAAQKATIKPTVKQSTTMYRNGKKLSEEEMEAAGISTGPSFDWSATRDLESHKVSKKQVEEALQKLKERGVPDNDPIITEFLLSKNQLKQAAAVFAANGQPGALNNFISRGITNYDSIKEKADTVVDKVKSGVNSVYESLGGFSDTLGKSSIGKTALDYANRKRTKLILNGIIRDGKLRVVLVCNVVDGDGRVRSEKKFICKLSKEYPVTATVDMLQSDIGECMAKNFIKIDKPITDILVVGNWAENKEETKEEEHTLNPIADPAYRDVVQGPVDHPFMDDTTWETINNNIPLKLQEIANALINNHGPETGFIDDGSQRFSKGGKIQSSKMRKMNKRKMKAARHKAGDNVIIKANPGEFVLNEDQMKNLQKLTGTSSNEEAFNAVREGKYSPENKAAIDALVSGKEEVKTEAPKTMGDKVRDEIFVRDNDATSTLKKMGMDLLNGVKDTVTTDVKTAKDTVLKVSSSLSTTVLDKLPDKFKSEKYRKIWHDAVKKGKSIESTIDEFAKKSGIDKQGKEVIDELKKACSKVTDEEERSKLIADTLAGLSTMKTTIVDKDKRAEALGKLKDNINSKMNTISEKAISAFESAKKEYEDKGLLGSAKSQIKKGWDWFKKTKFYKFISANIPEETKKQIKESFAKAKGDFSEAFTKAQGIAKDGLEKLNKQSEAKESTEKKETKVADVVNDVVPTAVTEDVVPATVKEEKPILNTKAAPKDISIAAPKIAPDTNRIAIDATPIATGPVITPETIIPTKPVEPVQAAGSIPGKITITGGATSASGELFEGDVESGLHKDFRTFALKQFEYNEKIISAAGKGGRGGVGGLLGGIAKGAGSAIGGGLNYLGQAVNGFYRGAGSAIGGIAKGVGSIGSAMFNSGFMGDMAKGLGTAIGGIGKGMGTAAGGFYKGVGTAVSGTARGLGTAISGVFGGGSSSGGLSGGLKDMITKMSRPKFIDVYVKGKIEAGNPVLSAKDQERGVFFMDGKPLQNTTDLTAPVYKVDEAGNKKVVVTQQDIDMGLVDAQGKDINSKAGGLKKGGGPFSGRGVGALLSGLFAGGGMALKGIGALYKGIFSGAGSLIEGTSKVVSTALGRMFGIDTEGNQKFHSDMITRFDKIIAILEGSAVVSKTKEEAEQEKITLKEEADTRAEEANKDRDLLQQTVEANAKKQEEAAKEFDKDRDAAAKYQKDKDEAEAKAKKDAENAEKSQNAAEQQAEITKKDKAKKEAAEKALAEKNAKKAAENAIPEGHKAAKDEDDEESGIGRFLKKKALKYGKKGFLKLGGLMKKTKVGRAIYKSGVGKVFRKLAVKGLGKGNLLKGLKHAGTVAGKSGGFLSKAGSALGSVGKGIGAAAKATGSLIGKIPGMSKLASVGGSLLGKAGTVGTSLLGKAGSVFGGVGSKLAGLVPGALGGAGGALGAVAKFAGPVGLAIAAGKGIWDATKGWNDAGKIMGKREEDVTRTDKGSAAVGNALSGLTFGLLSNKTAGKIAKYSGLGYAGGLIGNQVTNIGDVFRGDSKPLDAGEIEKCRAKLQNKVNKGMPGAQRILDQFDMAVKDGNWEKARAVSGKHVDNILVRAAKAIPGIGIGLEIGKDVSKLIFGDKDAKMSDKEIQAARDMFNAKIKKGNKTAEKLLSQFDDAVAEMDWKKARKLAGAEKRGLFGKLFQDEKGNVKWGKLALTAISPAAGLLAHVFEGDDPRKPMDEKEIADARKKLDTLVAKGNKSAEKIRDQFEEAVTEQNWKKARMLVGKQGMSTLQKLKSTAKWATRIGTLGLSTLFESSNEEPMTEKEQEDFRKKMNYLISKGSKVAQKKLDKFDEYVTQEKWERARSIAKMPNESKVTKAAKATWSFFWGDDDKEMTEQEMTKFRESMGRKIKMGDKVAQRKLDAFEDAVGRQNWRKARSIANASNDGVNQKIGKAIANNFVKGWRFWFGGDGEPLSEQEINDFRQECNNKIQDGDKKAQKILDAFDDAVADENWKKARALSGMKFKNAFSRAKDSIVKNVGGFLFGSEKDQLSEEEIDRYQKKCQQAIDKGDKKAAQLLEKFNDAVSREDWKRARQISGIKPDGVVGSTVKAVKNAWDWITGKVTEKDIEEQQEEVETKLLEDETGMGNKLLAKYNTLVQGGDYESAYAMGKDILNSDSFRKIGQKHGTMTDDDFKLQARAMQLANNIQEAADKLSWWTSPFKKARLNSLKAKVLNSMDEWSDEFFEECEQQLSEIDPEAKMLVKTGVSKEVDEGIELKKQADELAAAIQKSYDKLSWWKHPVDKMHLKNLKNKVLGSSDEWSAEWFQQQQEDLKSIDKDAAVTIKVQEKEQKEESLSTSKISGSTPNVVSSTLKETSKSAAQTAASVTAQATQNKPDMLKILAPYKGKTLSKQEYESVQKQIAEVLPYGGMSSAKMLMSQKGIKVEETKTEQVKASAPALSTPVKSGTTTKTEVSSTPVKTEKSTTIDSGKAADIQERLNIINEWKNKPSSAERTKKLKYAGVDFPDDTDDINDVIKEYTMKLGAMGATAVAAISKSTTPKSEVKEEIPNTAERAKVVSGGFFSGLKDKFKGSMAKLGAGISSLNPFSGISKGIANITGKAVGGIKSLFGSKAGDKSSEATPESMTPTGKSGGGYPEWWGSEQQKYMFVHTNYLHKTNGHLAGDQFGEHLQRGYKLFEAHKKDGTLDKLFAQFDFVPDQANDPDAPKYWKKEEERESKTIRGRIKNFGKQIGEKYEQIKDNLSEKASEMKDKFKASMSKTKDFVKDKYSKSKAFAKDKYEQLKAGAISAKDSIIAGSKKLAQNAMMGANQIGTWITDPESFKSDMKAVGTVVKDWWDKPGIGAKMMKGAKKLGLKAQMGFEGLKGSAARLADKGLGTLINMGNKYNEIRDRSIEGLKTGWDLAKVTGKNVWDWTKDTYSKGKEVATKAADWSKRAASNTWDFIKSGGLAGMAWRNRDKIKDWGMDKFNKAKDYASDVWTGTKAFAQEKYDQAKEFATNAWNKGKASVANAWDKTKQFGSDVLTGSKAMLSEGWDKAKGLFSNLWKKTKNKAVMGYENLKAMPGRLAEAGLTGLINMGEGYNKLRDRSIEGLKTGAEVIGLTAKNAFNSGKEWLNETWDKAKSKAIKLGLKTKMQWIKFQNLPNDIKLKVLDGTISAIEAIADKVGLESDKNGKLSIKRDKPAVKTPAALAKSATPKQPSKEQIAAANKVVDDMFAKNSADGQGKVVGVGSGAGIGLKDLEKFYKQAKGNKTVFESMIRSYFKAVNADDPYWDKQGPFDDPDTEAVAKQEREKYPDFNTRQATMTVMDQWWPELERRNKTKVEATAKSTPVNDIVKDTKRGGNITTAADQTSSGFARHDADKAEAIRKQQEVAAREQSVKQEDNGSKQISESIANSGNAQLGALDRIAGLLERQISATEGIGSKTERQANEASAHAVEMSAKATEAMVSPLRPKPQPTQPKPMAIDVNKASLSPA